MTPTKDIDRIADELDQRKGDTELTEKELVKVTGGTPNLATGKPYTQVTLGVNSTPAPEKHWFNGG